MGYYTAIKMNKLLLQATWMNLTNVMLGVKGARNKRMQTLFTEVTWIKGTDDSTTAESLTSSPGQRPSLGRLRPQVWPIWLWLVGGQC